MKDRRDADDMSICVLDTTRARLASQEISCVQRQSRLCRMVMLVEPGITRATTSMPGRSRAAFDDDERVQGVNLGTSRGEHSVFEPVGTDDLDSAAPAHVGSRPAAEKAGGFRETGWRSGRARAFAAMLRGSAGELIAGKALTRSFACSSVRRPLAAWSTAAPVTIEAAQSQIAGGRRPGDTDKVILEHLVAGVDIDIKLFCVIPLEAGHGKQVLRHPIFVFASPSPFCRLRNASENAENRLWNCADRANRIHDQVLGALHDPFPASTVALAKASL